MMPVPRDVETVRVAHHNGHHARLARVILALRVQRALAKAPDRRHAVKVRAADATRQPATLPHARAPGVPFAAVQVLTVLAKQTAPVAPLSLTSN